MAQKEKVDQITPKRQDTLRAKTVCYHKKSRKHNDGKPCKV